MSPALRHALLVEIAKAFPELFKQAEAAVKAKAAKGSPIGRGGRRLRRGLAGGAIFKAIWAYDDKGASRAQIRSMAKTYLDGQTLNENTLKRWLVILSRDEKIEKRNGRWFPTGARSPGVVKTRRHSLTQPFPNE
jgi:hypothetical protein